MEASLKTTNAPISAGLAPVGITTDSYHQTKPFILFRSPYRLARTEATTLPLPSSVPGLLPDRAVFFGSFLIILCLPTCPAVIESRYRKAHHAGAMMATLNLSRPVGAFKHDDDAFSWLQPGLSNLALIGA